MPGSTLTTVNAILKEVYEGRIENQHNEEVVASKRLEKSSDNVIETVGGKYVTFPIRVTRNHGGSYRAENTQLADPGQQGFAAVTVPLRYGYWRFKMTGQVMQLADKNYQAFASAMDDEMENMKNDIAKDTNRITYGNSSGNGVLANIAAIATSATQTVDNAQYLEPGMVVDVLIRSSGAATGGGTALTILTVNYTTNVITLSASIGATATTMGIYRTGNRNLEPTGLYDIVNATASLHGLDPALQPKWAGVVNSNSGTPRALGEGLMIQTADMVRKTGGKVSLILGSLGTRRAYFNLLTQQRRYADTKSFDGGFTGLAFNYGKEIPMVEDVDAPPNSMWFIDESKIKIFRSKPWHFADDDGNILKWVTAFDAWEGMMRCYWEMGTSQRNAHARLADIIEG